MSTQLERLARLEERVDSVLSTVDKNTAKLDRIHDLVQQGQGAAKASRWIGYGITTLIAFVAAQFGGFIRLPLH